VIVCPLLIAAALTAAAPAAEGQSVGDEEGAGRFAARIPPAADPGAPVSEPVWGVPIAHGAGLLVGMRASLSVLWPKSYALWPSAEMGRNIERAYTLPPIYDRHRRLLESDGGPLFLNTVGHGAFGSEVYQRARACRIGPVHSFVFTALTSAVWEYAVEALHHRPSAVDLIWTPVVGAAFGELRFQVWRLARGDPRRAPPRTRRALMILVDPFGEAERALGTSC
jgi:hypothetical protein